MSSPTLIAIQTPSSAANDDPNDSAICKLCHRQFAKYTCPTCNVPYCSLTCFRSEAHSQCSETFYKKEIETGIQSEPTKSAQERMQMLDLLKRFEEESAEDAEALEADADESDLAQRFAAVDLESVSPDALWSMLTPEEQKKFMIAMRDPSSEIAQQLLSSQELRENLREPWWTRTRVPDDPNIPRSDTQEEPTMMTIPESMLKPVPNRPLLVYNLASICLGYTFVIRHLGIASFSSSASDKGDLEAGYELLCQLLPFLLDRKSTLVYGGLSEVISDLWSRFDENTVTPELLATLLGDSAYLMTPLKVVESPDSSTDMLAIHSHRHLLLVLSDLISLVSLGLDGGWVPQKSKYVIHKLVFYGAHVATMPSPLLGSVAEELKATGKTFQDEAKARRVDGK
ncbi:hypothetical protein D9611_006356 [Ephemerocybe angulata]|uniref:HIT-type domain-containing protein n=1 Tax=Ephemerocybe angulata TaxID=980116 RepID=A0A8H5FGQ5_9AGAR|nr:hypothetical protein D9611_006356 [Tulosesus angulatus]